MGKVFCLILDGKRDQSILVLDLMKSRGFSNQIFEDLFNNKNISENKIYNTAKNLKIGVVLTAHPTEVKRRTLIQKYHNIVEILEQRDLLKIYPSKIKILDKKVNFKTTLLPYKLKTDYIEDILVDLKACLDSDKYPHSGKDCDNCRWYNEKKKLGDAIRSNQNAKD